MDINSIRLLNRFPRAFDESHTRQMLDFHLRPLTCVSVRFGTHYGLDLYIKTKSTAQTGKHGKSLSSVMFGNFIYLSVICCSQWMIV